MACVESIELINGKITFLYQSKYSFSEQKGLELFGKILRAVDEYLFNPNIDNCVVFSSHNKNIDCDIEFNGLDINIRYNNLRFSFDHNSLILSKDNIVSFLNETYGKGDIDFNSIGFKFFEQVLGIDTPYIMDSKIERVYLNNLKCFKINNPNGTDLKNGRYYKQIQNNTFINNPSNINNYFSQTNEQRLKDICLKMKNEGYLNKKGSIVLYNNSYVIRDGEHRASALLYLKGDIEIEVLRIWFSKNYYSYRLFYEKEC